MDLQQVGLRIKNCRKSLKLTQEELSEKVNVSAHYIYEIEKGIKTMSLFTLVDISNSLNVSTDYILFGNTSKGNSNNIPEVSDRLYLMTREIPVNKRERVADILSTIIPHLK